MHLSKVAAAALLPLLSACGRPQLADCRDRTPELDLVRYFDGRTYG